jgi:hypothetical protein
MGYKKIKTRDHPCADKAGMYPIHRLVVEAYLGRYLDPREAVHHINEIKSDNRIENLIVFESNSAHFSYHLHRRTKYRIRQCHRTGYVRAVNPSVDLGIVLYGPNMKSKRIQMLKNMAERTKKELGITTAL